MKPNVHFKSLVLCVTIAFSMNSHAATVTKAATGTDLAAGGSWGGTAPTSTDIATWNSASLGAGLTLDAPAGWQGIAVSGALSDVGISGAGSLTLGSDGIDLSVSSVNASISNNVAVNAAQTWKVAGGKSLVVSGVISGNSNLTFGSAGQSVTSSTFLTTTAATLFPNATLANLSSASGIMGGAYVSSGTVATGYNLSNNGTTATYQLQALDGGFTKAVKIQLDQVGADITAKAVYAKYNNGSTLGYNFDTGGNAGTVATTQAGAGYGAASTTLNFGQAASTGLVTLSGANTYTGSTTLTRGTLKAGVASVTGVSGAFGNNSAVSLANASGVTLDLNGFNTQIGSLTGGGALGGNVTLGAATFTVGGDDTSPAAFAGIISGTGGKLVKIGAGTLTLNGADTYTGGTTVTGGTLVGSSGVAFSGGQGGAFGTGDITVNVGATIRSAGVFVIGGGQTTTRTLNLVGGTANLQGGGVGGEYLRTINMTGGTVTVTSGTSYFRAPNGGISLNSLASATTSTITTGIDLTLGNIAIDVAQGTVPTGRDLVISGPISQNTGAGSGARSLTKTGAGRLVIGGNSNTYTGATTVNGGTLEVTGTISSASGAQPVAINSGATLTGTGTINRPVTVAANAILSPADAVVGSMTIGDALTLQGKTVLQVDKTSGVLTQDLVSAASVTYGGTLEISATGEALADGDSFQLFQTSSGTYGGVFNSYTLPTLPGGLNWDLSSLSTNGTIYVVSTTPAPLFSLPSGGYIGAQSVTISSDPGTTIHYTTDGNFPDANSPSAPSPATGITIPADVSNFIIYAYASKEGQGDSIVVSTTYNTVTSPKWIYEFGGTWSEANAWQNNVPATGIGVTADFSTVSLSSDSTVVLDSARTIGGLKFGDVAAASNWTLNSSNLLNLATNSGAPVIDVVNRKTTIGTILTGNQGLVKTGAGTLVLNRENLYTGATTVSAGSLLLDGSALPNQSSVIASTTINNAGSVTFYRSAANYTLNAASLSGAGDYYIDGPGGGGPYDNRIVFRGPSSDNTGTIHIVNSGRLWLDVANKNTIGDSALVDVGAAGTFRLYQGVSETIGGLTGSGVIEGGDAAGTSALTVGGGDRTASFSGAIQPTATTFTLTKIGTGTQTLSGTNTYTGATTINAGTLTVNGSLAAGSAVTVAAAGKLSGTGTVAGSVTSPGTIAPGDASVGHLTTGNTTLTGTFNCEISGATADSLTTGTLNITGATLAVTELTPGTAFPYTIATYTGTLTGSFTAPSGYVLDYSTVGVIKLNKAGAGFAGWAALNAPGETLAMDHDGDGVPNGIEYFMGLSGTGFTSNPGLDGSGKVSWIKGAAYAGVYGTDYIVQTSDDLEEWDNVPLNGVSDAASLEYTIPAGDPKRFTRLKVNGP